MLDVTKLATTIVSCLYSTGQSSVLAFSIHQQFKKTLHKQWNAHVYFCDTIKWN